MPDNNDTYKRRDFLKMGAVSSGTIAGGKLKTGHTAEKGENMHDSEEKIVVLDTAQENILKNGYSELLRLSEGLSYKKLPPEKYPYPLTMIAYDDMPEPERIRDDVRAGMKSDPVGVMEEALALLELVASNQKGIEKAVPNDRSFLSDAFGSKRLNGWAAMLGDSKHEALEELINERWKFRFFTGESPVTGLYTLLNMLVRYAQVYGRTRYHDDNNHHDHDHFMDEQHPGSKLDNHDMTHFIDEICPGLLICQGDMSDMELTISLMAMKIGVPAIVPAAFPFELGKTLRIDRSDEIAASVVLFPNIRRLLDFPDIPDLPAYCDSKYRKEKIKAHTAWGDTVESFYILRKGAVETTGFSVDGTPDKALGIIVTVDAEPMDGFDCTYIEKKIIGKLSYMKGVDAHYDDYRVIISQTKRAQLDPARIGEVIVAAIRREFPKLTKVHAEVIFDRARLSDLSPSMKEAKRTRKKEMAATTEENMDRFYSCVGCSAFTPNHMCVITPERPPQCGRPFEMIKTGALYAYDDMSNIHHNIQHRAMNSFQTFDKGICIDTVTGEWTGANEQIRRMTHSRTRRLLLHTLKENPHTGCGCFRLIMFETDKPSKGIGVMDVRYKGTCPDGRSWQELHYALGGKQTPGVAGANPDYLKSVKFLQADGGWSSVVWVSPDIAEVMGDKLPSSVMVGNEKDKDV